MLKTKEFDIASVTGGWVVGAMEYQAGERGSNLPVVTYFFLSFFSKILLSLKEPANKVCNFVVCA